MMIKGFHNSFFSFFVGKARMNELSHRIEINPLRGVFFEDLSKTLIRAGRDLLSSKIPGG